MRHAMKWLDLRISFLEFHFSGKIHFQKKSVHTWAWVLVHALKTQLYKIWVQKLYKQSQLIGKMRLYYLNHDFQAFVQLFVVQIVHTSIPYPILGYAISICFR